MVKADFLSVVTIHEIEKGIALFEYKGAAAKAAALRSGSPVSFQPMPTRLSPAHTAAAALAGQLEAKAIAAGHDPGMADALIAGIAKAHDLVIVTCNTKHFLPFGGAMLSPDEAAEYHKSSPAHGNLAGRLDLRADVKFTIPLRRPAFSLPVARASRSTLSTREL